MRPVALPPAPSGCGYTVLPPPPNSGRHSLPSLYPGILNLASSLFTSGLCIAATQALCPLAPSGDSPRLLCSLDFPGRQETLLTAQNLAQQRHEDPSSKSAHSLSTKQQGQQTSLHKVLPFLDRCPCSVPQSSSRREFSAHPQAVLQGSLSFQGSFATNRANFDIAG